MRLNQRTIQLETRKHSRSAVQILYTITHLQAKLVFLKHCWFDIILIKNTSSFYSSWCLGSIIGRTSSSKPSQIIGLSTETQMTFPDNAKVFTKFCSNITRKGLWNINRTVAHAIEQWIYMGGYYNNGYLGLHRIITKYRARRTEIYIGSVPTSNQGIRLIRIPLLVFFIGRSKDTQVIFWQTIYAKNDVNLN